MSDRTWFTSKEIKEEHKNLPIRQIYVWFVTLDKKLVIVGKGDKFQFPGGKPEEGESNDQTMKRELLEEAGLNIDEYGETPELFGYYLIENDINASWSGEPYLQLRYLLKVNASSSVINLSVNEKEGDLDNMEEAKFVDLDKLIDYIDWIKDREEYRVVLDLCSQSN